MAAMKPNKINGFVHESCGTALELLVDPDGK